MATVTQYQKLTTQEKQNRYFGESFKRKKVSEIERNLTRVSEVCREYQVSAAAVYKWIYKYGYMRKKGVKQVIEAKSDTRKLLQLQDQVKELERALGQKQIKIDFLEKQIEIAEETYQVDIKKKLNSKHSTGTGSTGKNTDTK